MNLVKQKVDCHIFNLFNNSNNKIFKQTELNWNLFEVKISSCSRYNLNKCIKEENSGNTEFISAKKTLEEAINSMKIEEVTVFCEEFLPSYYKTLDELHMGQEK